MPVLAEFTAQVAAHGAKAENARAGIKVVERFLFDGVQGETGGAAVGGAVESSAFIFSHIAETAGALRDAAIARTQITKHLALFNCFPPSGWLAQGGWALNCLLDEFFRDT